MLCFLEVFAFYINSMPHPSSYASLNSKQSAVYDFIMFSATMSRGVCLLSPAVGAPPSRPSQCFSYATSWRSERRPQLLWGKPFQTGTSTVPDLSAEVQGGRIEKGTYLKSLFPLNDRDAGRVNDGHPAVSPWQDPKAIARWGWTTRTKWAPFPRTSTAKFDENLPSFRNLSMSHSRTQPIAWTHPRTACVSPNTAKRFC
ncbi:hypothetical protein LY76DRAFT_78288 [Colletotrichum caudatum]|nr:hypothetical protein LY76DRAFT_78288 [Colletotrichum caudatum]